MRVLVKAERPTPRRLEDMFVSDCGRDARAVSKVCRYFRFGSVEGGSQSGDISGSFVRLDVIARPARANLSRDPDVLKEAQDVRGVEGQRDPVVAKRYDKGT